MERERERDGWKDGRVRERERERETEREGERKEREMVLFLGEKGKKVPLKSLPMSENPAYESGMNNHCILGRITGRITAVRAD